MIKKILILIVLIIVASIVFLTFKKTAPQSLPTQDTSSPFGMHQVLYRPFLATGEKPDLEKLFKKDGYEEAQDIGVRWERAHNIGVIISPRLPPYDWHAADLEISVIPKGIDIVMNFWAHETPFTKRGTWQFADVRAKQAYVEFIKAFVERYDGDGKDDMPGLENPVKYWQIENEPFFNNLAPGERMNLDSDGVAELMNISYGAIKSSDSEAKVLLGGTLGGELLYIDPVMFQKQLNELYLPVLKKLAGKDIDIFDMHYYGECGPDSPRNWYGSKAAHDVYREILDENGYRNIPIWFTETGCPGEAGQERSQASDLVKRYVYPLSYGVKKVFWFTLVEGYPPLSGNDYFDHIGLVFDGIGSRDPGYGVKKLSYYAYKKMTETLEGSDRNNIQTIQNSDGVYIFRFMKSNKPIWVAWNENPQEKQIIISGITSSRRVKITEAIPKYESGKGVVDYSSAFNSEIETVHGNKVSITLGNSPLFIEEE